MPFRILFLLLRNGLFAISTQPPTARIRIQCLPTLIYFNTPPTRNQQRALLPHLQPQLGQMAEPELSSQELLEATSRPLVPRGTSPPPTQPLPSEFEKRVVKVKRRFTQERRPKSIKFQQRFRSLLFADTSSELRTKVLHEVRLRLSRVGIETKLVPDRFFAWLLPKNGAVVGRLERLAAYAHALVPHQTIRDVEPSTLYCRYPSSRRRSHLLHSNLCIEDA